MKQTDPVCGMQVDEKTPYKSEHGGKAVYFCSAPCKAKFDKSPDQYSAKGDRR